MTYEEFVLCVAYGGHEGAATAVGTEVYPCLEAAKDAAREWLASYGGEGEVIVIDRYVIGADSGEIISEDYAAVVRPSPD